ncbi:MAG: hypothetical protein IJ660_00700 [Alphaproteobacteria bacterium]|nr:hypothetical protein [Alphaproteobacteria bacterium]
MATELNTGKDLIDATQNAVLNAAENMAEMMEETAAAATGHEHEAFYQGAEFWVAMAFVLTVLLLARPIFKAVSGLIGKHIAGVRERIDNAEQLQHDAEQLLASYEHKFRNVKKEAETILKKSQNEIEYMRKASISRMEQEMAQKEKDVADKLAEAKNSAVKEISEIAGNLSITAARKLIAQNLSDKEIDALIEKSIEKLDKAI